MPRINQTLIAIYYIGTCNFRNLPKYHIEAQGKLNTVREKYPPEITEQKVSTLQIRLPHPPRSVPPSTVQTTLLP